MWRILKAEINYDKLRIAIFFVLSFCSFIAIWFGVKWDRNRVPMTMLIILVLTLSAGYAEEKIRTLQKRDRFHALLPVSLWRIGISHLVYPVIILIGMILLFFCSSFIIQPLYGKTLTKPSFLQILTLSGLVLIVNAVILLHRDLRVIFAKKYQRALIFLFWFVFYIGAILPFYIVTNFFGFFGENIHLQKSFVKLSESPAWFLIPGVAISLISLSIFIKRKSYAS